MHSTTSVHERVGCFPLHKIMYLVSLWNECLPPLRKILLLFSLSERDLSVTLEPEGVVEHGGEGWGDGAMEASGRIHAPLIPIKMSTSGPSTASYNILFRDLWFTYNLYFIYPWYLILGACWSCRGNIHREKGNVSGRRQLHNSFEKYKSFSF